jgi:pimeloyl-ACP methyl ester carboxylesterase
MPLNEQTGIWYADHRDPIVHRTPVLMIHGAGGTHLDWPAELRRLPEANAITPDLPGHGRSKGPGFNTVGGYAAALIGLLDALKLQQVIVLGFSMGGAIAQMMALQHKARVAGLILLATSAKMTVHPDILNGLQTDYDTALQTLIDRQWAEEAGDQVKRLSLRRLQAIDPAVLRGDYQAVNSFDVRIHLSQIQVPTLILSGTADRMTPSHDSDYMHEHVVGSQLVKIDGGGHLMALEQPQAVADAVQAWLLEVFP